MEQPDLPTFQELIVAAPIATIVMIVVGIAFWAGYRSREEHIKTLKEWLEDYRRKRGDD